MMSLPSNRFSPLARSVLALTLTGGLGFLAALGTGCEEKKAPKVVEAPPPPPPAPPPPMSLSSLAQELKVDARVQIADKINVSDEAFARAALRLTSAIAKGDAVALKPLLSARSAAILAELQASEQWVAATKGLEAVRIVAAGSPPGAMVINPLAGGSDAGAAAIKQLIDQAAAGATRGLSPEAAARERELFERRIREEAERTLAAGTKAAPAAGGEGTESPSSTTDPKGGSNAKQLEQLMIALLAAEANNQKANQIFNQGTNYILLLALQDDHGAYLMGWQATKAGDSYSFDMAPSAPEIRRRASDFDALGTRGFEIAPPSRFAAALPAPGAKGKAGDADAAASRPASGGGGGGGG